MAESNPTYREVREYLIEENGWTEEEWDAFHTAKSEFFDGFQETRLSYDAWTILVMEYIEEEGGYEE